MSASGVAVAPSGSLELLRDESELINLAYLSGRAITALLKRQHGHDLDDTDTSCISQIGELFRVSANSQRFFETNEGPLPQDAFAPQVDVTIEVASKFAKTTQNPSSQSSNDHKMSLHEQIKSYSKILKDDDMEVPEDLIEFLMWLSESILDDMASIGEIFHDHDLND